MKDDSANLNPGVLTLEVSPVDSAGEIGTEPNPFEFSVRVHGNAWPRAQASAREFALLPSPTEERHCELVLSGTQLLLGVTSALGSIFLVVWALINLWLTES